MAQDTSTAAADSARHRLPMSRIITTSAAEAVVFYLYDKAFGNNQMGYGSAMAFILAIFIFIVTAINFKVQDKWVKTIE